MPRALLCCCMVLLSLPAVHSDLVWDFSSGPEGWRVTDLHCASSYISVINVYAVNWLASGGSPEGYIQMRDPASNCFFFDAPAEALGNWSSYSGGCLEFSLKSNVRDWPQDNAVALIGANGVSLIALIQPLPVPQWAAYAVQLLPANFRKNNIGGPAASEADLAGVLASVAALRISGEYGGSAGQEIVGLDSVRITPRRVLGIRGAHTIAEIAPESARRFWFRVWGRVSGVTLDSFLVDDGSGRTVLVQSASHGVAIGSFVVAEGLLNVSSTPPVLTSAADLISTEAPLTSQ